jgi:hypothetical protein
LLQFQILSINEFINFIDDNSHSSKRFPALFRSGGLFQICCHQLELVGQPNESISVIRHEYDTYTESHGIGDTEFSCSLLVCSTVRRAPIQSDQFFNFVDDDGVVDSGVGESVDSLASFSSLVVSTVSIKSPTGVPFLYRRTCLFW